MKITGSHYFGLDSADRQDLKIKMESLMLNSNITRLKLGCLGDR